MGVNLTQQQIQKLSDDKLYALSLQKTKRGHYSRDANRAYEERHRRSGYAYFDGIEKRCGKFQADIDYYGDYIE